MGKKTFTPLELALIDEGEFLSRGNEDLMDCQHALLEFHKTYGERAEGVKAKLTIEVTIACDNPKEGMFSIKAVTKKSLPTRPASVSMAWAERDQAGQQCLLVRQSGSDDGNPRQEKLATRDGRPIDVDTGKPIDVETGEVKQ